MIFGRVVMVLSCTLSGPPRRATSPEHPLLSQNPKKSIHQTKADKITKTQRLDIFKMNSCIFVIWPDEGIFGDSGLIEGARER